MRRRTLHRLGRLLVASLLGLAAPAQAQAPAPFDVKVTFEGLIAFVEDKDAAGKDVVWALLVDADYDPNSFTADDVPPCAWAEVPPDRDPKIELPKLYPPHKAWITFKNAKDVTGTLTTSQLEQGFALAGRDLRFAGGFAKGLVQGSKYLPALAQSSRVSDSRRTATPVLGPSDPYHHLDQVRSEALDPGWLTASSVISSRLLIDGGTNLRQKDPGSAGYNRFSFKSPTDSHFDCFDNQVLASTPLAEATVWETPAPLGRLDISDEGSPWLSLEPANRSAPLKITIFNTTAHSNHEHYQSHRWFYRIAQNTHDSTSCRDHYWPCLQQKHAGGNKCPQARMVR